MLTGPSPKFHGTPDILSTAVDPTRPRDSLDARVRAVADVGDETTT